LAPTKKMWPVGAGVIGTLTCEMPLLGMVALLPATLVRLASWNAPDRVWRRTCTGWEPPLPAVACSTPKLTMVGVNGRVIPKSDRRNTR